MDDDEVQIEQDDELRRFMGTTSFGKQRREASAKKQVEASKRPTAVVSGGNGLIGYEDSNEEEGESKNGKTLDSDDSEDDDDDDDDDEDEYPVSHEMVMKTHEKAVTVTSLDPSGGRLVTGSMDCTLKFHDFASMTPTTIRAFKRSTPQLRKATLMRRHIR